MSRLCFRTMLSLGALLAPSSLCAQAHAPHGAAAVAEPAPAPVPFAPQDAQQVIPALATALEQTFVVPETGRRYAAAIRAGLAAGKYDRFATQDDFAKQVTADLQSVAKDGHLKLFTPAAAARFAAPRRRPDGMADDFIDKAETIAPGIAYISFSMFSGSDAEIGALTKFLDDHDDAKALILDLRNHRGGGIDEMDVMFSRFFAKPTDLLAMDTRASVDAREGSPFDGVPSVTKVAAPADVVRRMHRAIPGAKRSGLAAARIFVLTSPRSASAAEHFALALKRTGRATLIGETTRGAGNYGHPVELPGGYAAFIPLGRTFDPSTGVGWEGTGVAPDIAVPADQALDKALELAKTPPGERAPIAGS